MPFIEEWPLITAADAVRSYRPGMAPTASMQQTLRRHGALTAGIRLTRRIGPHNHGQVRVYSSLNRLSAALHRLQRSADSMAVQRAAGRLEAEWTDRLQELDIEPRALVGEIDVPDLARTVLVELARATRRAVDELGVSADHESRLTGILQERIGDWALVRGDDMFSIAAAAVSMSLNDGSPVVLVSTRNDDHSALVRVLPGIEVANADEVLDERIGAFMAKLDSPLALTASESDTIGRLRSSGLGVRQSNPASMTIVG